MCSQNTQGIGRNFIESFYEQLCMTDFMLAEKNHKRIATYNMLFMA